jgi:hypothetical protein
MASGETVENIPLVVTEGESSFSIPNNGELSRCLETAKKVLEAIKPHLNEDIEATVLVKTIEKI